ncbi:MAG TPA: hypothetical protein VKE98_00010 [Gemmataceae bacterium]|nr:hypothetical protein [Gemmataceae bacterium]
MGQTFYFLTATWLAAQGADTGIWTRDLSPCGCQQTYTDGYVHAVGNWESSSGCGCNQGFSGGSSGGFSSGYSGGFSGGHRVSYSGSYQERPSILTRIQNRLNTGFSQIWPFRHQAEGGEIYAGEGAIMPSAGPGVIVQSSNPGTIMQSTVPGQPMPSGRLSEPPLGENVGHSTPRTTVEPSEFHSAPPASHGLLIEPEPH